MSFEKMNVLSKHSCEGKRCQTHWQPDRYEHQKTAIISALHFILSVVILQLCLLPSSLYSPVEMPASRDRVIRSPRLAAIGVATLSGLMPTFLDATITPIMISPVGPMWLGTVVELIKAITNTVHL